MLAPRFDYFIALARERSFTRAAEQLHITQQTLSNYIAQLEKELGNQLFIRHIPLELTFAGETYLRHALTIYSQMQTLQHEMDDIAQNEKGILKIGVAFSRGHIVLPRLLTAYQKKHPFMHVRLIEAPNENLVTKLLNKDIDLAILNFTQNQPGVVLRDFYDEENVLFVSDELLNNIYGANKDVILKQLQVMPNMSLLRDCPFVLMNEDNIAGRIARDYLTQEGFTPNIKVESDNIETLLSLCVEGCGACFCPENFALKTLPPEKLAKLHTIRLGEDAKYKIYFGYLKQSYQWRSIDKFIDEAVQFVENQEL